MNKQAYRDVFADLFFFLDQPEYYLFSLPVVTGSDHYFLSGEGRITALQVLELYNGEI